MTMMMRMVTPLALLMARMTPGGDGGVAGARHWLSLLGQGVNGGGGLPIGVTVAEVEGAIVAGHWCMGPRSSTAFSGLPMWMSQDTALYYMERPLLWLQLQQELPLLVLFETTLGDKMS